MKTYTVSEAREHFAEVLETVAQGEEVTITKHGEPVAAITHPSAGKKARAAIPPPGFLKAEGWQIEMADDFDAIPEGFEDYV
jgi:prevent-host-death family protein